MSMPNGFDFCSVFVCKKHDTMVVSCVSMKCSTIERWGGVQMMAHTERVTSFLRGETYNLSSVKIWLNSMHILYVKNTIQWSFHVFR